MIFPRPYPWTRQQRWLILGLIVFACISVGALVYGYERHFRGPDESVFYGTWDDPFTPSDEPSYFEFRKDHTFRLWFASSGERITLAEGRWYAGGPNLYLRFPPDFLGPDSPRRPTVMHIADISPDDIAVRLFRDERPYHFRRAHLNAP